MGSILTLRTCAVRNCSACTPPDRCSRPSPPGRAGQQKAARLPGLPRFDLPRPAHNPALAFRRCLRSPLLRSFVARCHQASKRPLAWRHLPSHGLPGPAKSRRAYAEQNAPLLLFFRLLLCRPSLTRATARLLLVVLPFSKSKSVLFIWLSQAGLPRQHRPWSRARAESARLNLACPSWSTAAFPGAGKRRLGSTAFPAWPRVLLPACHGACCHALHITPHYANALYSRAKALP